MMSKAKVESVGYSHLHNCVVIKYYTKGDDMQRVAAVAKMLSVKVGDTVWVLQNDELSYKGFNAVAVLIA